MRKLTFNEGGYTRRLLALAVAVAVAFALSFGAYAKQAQAQLDLGGLVDDLLGDGVTGLVVNLVTDVEVGQCNADGTAPVTFDALLQVNADTTLDLSPIASALLDAAVIDFEVTDNATGEVVANPNAGDTVNLPSGNYTVTTSVVNADTLLADAGIVGLDLSDTSVLTDTGSFTIDCAGDGGGTPGDGGGGTPGDGGGGTPGDGGGGTPGGGDQSQTATSQYGDIDQTQLQCVQNAMNNNAQYNEAGDNVNMQNIAQECNISVTQVENVVAVISGGGMAGEPGDTAGGDTAGGDMAGGGESGDGEEMSVLPDTGGISMLTAGAGALLIAGGLLARRLVR